MSAAASNLLQRALSACLFVPLVLGLAWMGGWWLFALVLAIVGRGSWELLFLARQAGYRPGILIGVLLAVSVPLYIQLCGADRGLILLLLMATLAAFSLTLCSGTEGYLRNSLLTLSGVLYLGLPGSAPLLLASHVGELAPVVLVSIFLSIWLTDAFAYGGGRMWGQRRLVPSISPGKTVVGFACGMLGAVVPVALIEYLPGWPVPLFVGLCLTVGVVSQLGDIVESAIKRDLGVKDAPSLIPGHGGMLDRFDSYLFAFPVAVVYIVLLKS